MINQLARGTLVRAGLAFTVRLGLARGVLLIDVAQHRPLHG